jgi:zinc transporter ZupT
MAFPCSSSHRPQISGMMTWISVAELLPEARRHDPEDRVTSAATGAGFGLMAATLVGLAYAGAPEGSERR